MKFEVDQQRLGSQVIEPDEFCCDRMQAAWKNNLIEYSDSLSSGERNTIGFFAYQYDDVVGVAIAFCPFCSQKIEIE